MKAIRRVINHTEEWVEADVSVSTFVGSSLHDFVH